jgi:protein-disulfide isomerase
LAAAPWLEIAVSTGVPDTARFKLCLANEDPVERIESGIRRAREYGNGGTPSIIVNGERFPGGGPSLAELKGMLDTLSDRE